MLRVSAADILLEALPSLQALYVPYTLGFDRSNTTLQACMKQGAWKSFLAIYQRDLGQKDLGTHLILPIQRTPRYVLLIKEVSAQLGFLRQC
jgi:hypothetical protein